MIVVALLCPVPNGVMVHLRQIIFYFQCLVLLNLISYFFSGQLNKDSGKGSAK